MMDTLAIPIDDMLLISRSDIQNIVSTPFKNFYSDFGVFIAAPKMIDFDQVKNFPIYIAVKENSVDNEVMKTSFYGHLVFNHTETGELFIFKTFPQEKQAKSRTVAPPPGYTPVKQTTVYFEYREIEQTALPTTSGVWSIFEHSGNFKSNTIFVENVSNKDEEQIASQQRQSDNERLEAITCGIPETFKHPQIEISLNSKEPSTEQIPVSIKFSVPSLSIAHSKGAWVHLLISAKEIKTLRSVSFFTPEKDLKVNDDLASGIVTFNAAKLFYNHTNDSYQSPDKFYLTGVSDRYSSDIKEIELSR